MENVSAFFVEERLVESLLIDLLAAIWDPGVRHQLPGAGRAVLPMAPAGSPAAQAGVGLLTGWTSGRHVLGMGAAGSIPPQSVVTPKVTFKGLMSKKAFRSSSTKCV